MSKKLLVCLAKNALIANTPPNTRITPASIRTQRRVALGLRLAGDFDMGEALFGAILNCSVHYCALECESCAIVTDGMVSFTSAQ